MPLRILHALYTVDPGHEGVPEDVRLLLAVNRHLKHQVEILTFASGEPWCREAGIKIHGPGDGGAKGGSARQFTRWLREHAAGYDCVLVSGVSGCDAYRVWQALRASGAPYFVFAPDYSRRARGMPGYLEVIKQRFCWVWAGYPLFRDAHAVFFSSEEAKREAPAGLWPYDCHEFVLPSGAPDVAANLNKGREGGFLEGRPDLVGKRLFSVPESGEEVPESLFNAVKMLIAAGRWDRDSMRLLIAGFADGRPADALSRSLRRHGLVDVVHVTDALRGPERWGVLQASEAVVQPASAKNSGRVVAKAFCLGKPVLIAKGVNQWREVAGHSAGLADEDTSAGYQALFSRWLHESPADRAAMGLNARKAYEAHYTEHAAANMLTAVIYLLIGAGQSGLKSADPDVFRHEVDFL